MGHVYIYIYVYTGISLSLKKEGHFTICYHTDKFWGHYDKRSKPGIKGQILHEYTLRPKAVEVMETDSRTAVASGCGEERMESCLMGTKFQFGKTESSADG